MTSKGMEGGGGVGDPCLMTNSRREKVDKLRVDGEANTFVM